MFIISIQLWVQIYGHLSYDVNLRWTCDGFILEDLIEPLYNVFTFLPLQTDHKKVDENMNTTLEVL